MSTAHAGAKVQRRRGGSQGEGASRQMEGSIILDMVVLHSLHLMTQGIVTGSSAEPAQLEPIKTAVLEGASKVADEANKADDAAPPQAGSTETIAGEGAERSTTAAQ